MDNEPLCILGGGLSGLSFAFFSKKKAVLFEKEEQLGGLCRSFETNGIWWDIGPHIFFSKDREALDFLVSQTAMHQRRRSNRIFYNNAFVKYPFENELSALPEKDKNYCLNSFLDNPYARYPAPNMLMFFYQTFGEGITRLYLEPYNRKIWKFEPSFMDTQMVERIPKPPPEDIIASAKGNATEGYLHQLYFNYPNAGGTASIIRGLAARCAGQVDIHTGTPVEKVRLKKGAIEVIAGGTTTEFSRVISTIPLHELVPRISPAPPQPVTEALKALIFNSIHITIVQATTEHIGDNYAIMFPQPDVSFHRISKVDFLGDRYTGNGVATVMAEITYRAGDRFDLSDDDITELVVSDLDKTGMVPRSAVKTAFTRSFPYAYVIYDFSHRKNADIVLSWLKNAGITCIGRFSAFEYINMDAAITRARAAALAA